MLGPRNEWAAGLLAMLGLAGCASLPDIPQNQCGNGIVEQTNGEDCDGIGVGLDGGASDSDAGNACSAQCRVMCEGDAGTCPSGWGCGTDHLCRRPGGTFTATGVQVNENVEHLGLADLDHSGRKAIVVDTGAQLDVHYLDERGAVSQTISLTELQPTPVVGDFDGDGIADVVYRLDTALAVRKGARDQSLTALPFPVALPGPQGPGPDLQIQAGERLLAVDAKGILEKSFPLKELLRLGPNSVTSFFGNTSTMAPPVTIATVGSSSLWSPDAAVPVGKWDEGALCDQFVLANHSPRQLEVYTTCRPGVGMEPPVVWNSAKPVAVSLAGKLPWVGPAFNVDVDGDKHRDLVVFVAADDQGTLGEILVAYGDGTGHFRSTLGGPVDDQTGLYMCLSGLTFTSLNASLVGCATRPPLAVGDFNGDHSLDLVNACGVFLSSLSGPPSCLASSGTLQPVVTARGGLADAEWSIARVADLNGDGIPDVIAASCAAASVTYLENAGDGFFDAFTIPTLGGVDDLAVGDYDGDLVEDLIYVERTGTSPECEDPAHPDRAASASLGAIFGGLSGGPTPPIVLAQLGAVDQIVAANLTSTLDQFTPISNLAAISANPMDNGHRLLDLFQGRTDREIIAPYFLVSPDNVAANTPWLMAMGHFGDPSAPTGLALLTVERNAGVDAARVWFLGQSSGSLGGEGPVLTLKGVVPGEYLKDNATKAAWLTAADLGGPPGDEVVGLTVDWKQSTSNLVVFTQQQDGTWPADPTVTPLPSGGYGGPIVVGDVDADGRDDLILFSPGAGALVVWNTGQGSLDKAPTTPITLDALDGAKHADGTSCGDPGLIVAAVALRTAPALPRQLLIVGEHQSYVASLAPASPGSHMFTLSCETGLPTTLSPEALVAAGDVDGDGIDDVVIGQPGSVQLFHGAPVVQ